MKATATRLKATPITLKLTELEVKASKVVPKQTPKVKEGGYNGYRAAMNAVPADVRDKLIGAQTMVTAGGGARVGPLDTVELGRLVNGRHTALEIKKLLDGQADQKVDLQRVLNYLDYLKAAGLVEIPEPVVTKKKTH